MIWKRRQDERTNIRDLVVIAQKAPKFEYEFDPLARTRVNEICGETLYADFNGSRVEVEWQWPRELSEKGKGLKDEYLSYVRGCKLGKSRAFPFFYPYGAHSFPEDRPNKREARRIKKIARIAKTKYLASKGIFEDKNPLEIKYDEFKKNPRFYVNFFGGPILTSAGTVALARYMMFPEYENPISEAVYWASATIASLPMQIVSIPVGFILGGISAIQTKCGFNLDKCFPRNNLKASELENKAESNF